MVRDLLFKEIVKDTRDIHEAKAYELLDESIQVAEQMFGKSLKAMPPQGEEQQFIGEMYYKLVKENFQDIATEKMVEDFIKSGMSLSNFLETMAVGFVGDVGRGGLYDTTRVLFNGGNSTQDYANVDQDDIGGEVVYNDGVNFIPPIRDLFADVGENGISKYALGNAETAVTGATIKFRDENGQMVSGEVLDTGEDTGVEDNEWDYMVRVIDGENAGKIMGIKVR
jgi:hypothetical protein